MTIGLFIVLNFCAIPFLNELEVIGQQERRLASVRELIWLRRTRRQRWFVGFLVLLALLGTIALAPAASGQSHPLPIAALLTGLAAQVGLWTYALRRVRRAIAEAAKTSVRLDVESPNG